jgi:hypothetical protein
MLLSLLQKSFSVIPAKAGIQVFQGLLDPGFRRGNGFVEFCKSLYWLDFKKVKNLIF